MSLRHDALHALDVQLDLINLYGSRFGQQLMEGFLTDQVNKDNYDLDGSGVDRETFAIENGRRLARDLHGELGRAPTYYLTPDMLALGLHAGETAPAEPFTAAELPTPSGFVLLPEPLVVGDRWGKRISCRAFAWWTADVVTFNADGDKVSRPTLLLAEFSTKTDDDVDDYMAALRAEDPDEWLAFPPWSVVHWVPLHFGDQWWGEGEEPPGSIESWIAFVKTFFLLVRQEVAVARPEHLDRAHLRRLRGTGLAPEYGDLRIVTLRRLRPVHDERTEEAEGGGIEWSHRWIVSGHWRDQPYPSEGVTRPIWIEAFEKGPADRPLIVKDRVFVWKR